MRVGDGAGVSDRDRDSDCVSECECECECVFGMDKNTHTQINVHGRLWVCYETSPRHLHYNTLVIHL